MTLQGWHPGERAIRQRLSMPAVSDQYYQRIAPEMPEQHRIFYTTNLHFLPLVTLDSLGRPWGSVLSGEDGLPGFINPTTRRSTLSIRAKTWPDDPLLSNLKTHQDSSAESMLAAGIGVEWSTRRRNKLAGYIPLQGLVLKDGILDFELVVNEALGLDEFLPSN